MNAEEQLHKLKQMPPLSKEEKRKKIATAIVLALATIISILFLVYAFIQKMEADKNLAEAMRQEKITKEAMMIADQQRIIAEAAKAEADRQRAIAVQALADCKGK